MNSEAFIDKDFSPRPKINRLPLLPIYEANNNENSSDNYIIWRSIYIFGIITLLVIIFITYQYNTGLSKNTVVASDDSRLMALVNSSGDIIETSNSELYFKDNGGIIVGQMVKITPSLEKNAINATNNDDLDAERELLAILSKY